MSDGLVYACRDTAGVRPAEPRLGWRAVTAATSTVASMKILHISPALHGAKMQTSRGTFPVVVWALVRNDDGSDDVIGLAVGGKGDRALVRPDPDTFESYSQTG